MIPTLAFVYPLPPDKVAAALAAVGLASFAPLQAAVPVPPACPALTLTKAQGEIASALTRKPPLNERQVAILEIYWQAHRQGEPALPIEIVAARLVQKIEVDPAKAVDYVKGSLRSFGKRLFGALSKVPLQLGRDAMGEGVADEIPLLAMISIQKGAGGEARHKLTSDGAIAVAAALAMNSKGEAASSPASDTDDPDEMVTLAVPRSAAALVMRVAATKGIDIGEAMKLGAALAGAG